jgi:lysophospholipase L1-like esterase
MFRKNLTDYINSKKAVTKVVDRGAVLLKTSRSEKEWEVINSKLTSWHFEYANWVEKFEQSMCALAPRKVIVVVCPCSSRKTELFTGENNLEAFLTRISKLSNVIVINYYGSDKFSDSDFTDPTHFNAEGARKFSRMLKKEIGC